MIAYKLLRVRKNGTLGPLFINRSQVIPVGEWLTAGCFPTKGFKVRPGWHVTGRPYAPHLSMEGRIWARVEIKDFELFDRPANQGGRWYIAKKMKVLSILHEGV